MSVAVGVLEPLIIRLPNKSEVYKELASLRKTYFDQGIWSMGGFEEGEQVYINPETAEKYGKTYIYYLPAKDPNAYSDDVGQPDDESEGADAVINPNEN